MRRATLLGPGNLYPECCLIYFWSSNNNSWIVWVALNLLFTSLAPSLVVENTLLLQWFSPRLAVKLRLEQTAGVGEGCWFSVWGCGPQLWVCCASFSSCNLSKTVVIPKVIFCLSDEIKKGTTACRYEFCYQSMSWALCLQSLDFLHFALILYWFCLFSVLSYSDVGIMFLLSSHEMNLTQQCMAKE